MTKHIAKTIIGLLIGAFFVWLSAKDWPLDRLLGAPTLSDGTLFVGPPETGWRMECAWLWPYLGILVAIHFLRVIRWQPLLDPIVKLGFSAHNRIGAVGFMAMFLFPLRLGELVRPYLVKRHTGGKARGSEVLATVVVERVVDGLMVALLLFAILAALPATDPATTRELHIGATAALLVFVGASVLLAGARWKHALTQRLVERTIGLVSKGLAAKICDILDAFLRGLGRLPSARAFVWFLFLSAVYWAINGLGVWCMVRAFGLPVDMVGAYAMMCCVVVGMMIPNSPGNVGSFWYFLLLPVLLYGVTHDSVQALACGLMVWLLQLLQQTAFGLWYIARGKVTWAAVTQATFEDEDSLTAPSSPAPSAAAQP